MAKAPRPANAGCAVAVIAALWGWWLLNPWW